MTDLVAVTTPPEILPELAAAGRLDHYLWRDVPTHAGYQASDRGLIRGPSGRVLRPMVDASGHHYVLTHRQPRKLFVHRAVLLAFVGPAPDGHEARHLSGDPGDSRLVNLRWGTRQENADDRVRHGRAAHPTLRRLTSAAARLVRVDPRSSRVLAARLGVSHTTIQAVRRGERYRGI